MITDNSKKEILFWSLQFVGWYAVSSFVLIISEFSTTLKVYSLIVGGIIGVVVTSIYRV